MKELPSKDLPDVSGGQVPTDTPPYVPYPQVPGSPVILDGPDAPSKKQLNA